MSLRRRHCWNVFSAGLLPGVQSLEGCLGGLLLLGFGLRQPTLALHHTNRALVEVGLGVAGRDASSTRLFLPHRIITKPSPDYCRLNPQLGYKGVKGRTCAVDPSAPDQTERIRKCTSLCTSCGMYAMKQVVDVVTSCNCKFEWCCKITCDTCHKKQIRITCTNMPPSSSSRFFDLINKH